MTCYIMFYSYSSNKFLVLQKAEISAFFVYNFDCFLKIIGNIIIILCECAID